MNRERFRWLRTRCSRLFRRRRQEAALDAELQFHLDQLIAEYHAEGLSEHDARCAAQREFGATDVYREETRDAWRPPALADWWRSLRFAVRSLARSPGFTVVAIITLGLGIGANTSMFSLLNYYLLRPLPYSDSKQLDRIYRTTAQNPEGGVSPADFLDLQQEMHGYGEITAFTFAEASLSEPGQPAEMAPAIRVTANFFSTLRVQPQLGRDFRTGEDQHGNDRLLLISQRCWQNRFGGRADIIGRTVRVDGEPHEIVGVLPAAFYDSRHLGWVELFRPLGLDQKKSNDRNATHLRLIGRRSTTLSRTDAEGFIAHFGSRLAADFPEANAGTTWRTVPLNDTVDGKHGSALLILPMLIGLSGFVLLIACSNLANLLLARTMARAREFAVRSALGASRIQLLRPLVIESLVLALAGGAGAILVAQWTFNYLAVRSTGDNGDQLVLALDWPVLGWALAASLATVFAFGLAPALFALRLDLNGTLKNGARGIAGGRGHRRFRHVLIVGQFALAMVLLAGAANFIRGLDELNHRRSGWESKDLVTGTILLPVATYAGAEEITAFHRLMVERLEALPGVASASISYSLPFYTPRESRQYLVEGRELPEPGHEPVALINGISPRYFETVGSRLLAGRAFNERDTLAAPRVFVISEAMARGLFGDESPIGRHLAQGGGAAVQRGEIVGVVNDVVSVVPDTVRATWQLYQPIAQEPRAQNEIAVRTTGVAPATVVDDIRTLMTELDPDLPVRRLQPADATIVRANYQLGVLRDVLSAFAVLGLALASLGIYGVIARTMAQRTGEFAIRLALGARVGDITHLVLANGVMLALVGSAIGLFGAFGVSHLIAAGFPGLQASSPSVIVGVTLVLIAVALLACYLPARRAARINPIEALRAE